MKKIVKLGDVLDYEQPTKYIVESTNYADSFKIPVLTAGKTFILGYTDEGKGVFDNLPVIIFDDFTTAFHYVDFPFKVKSSAMKILKPVKEKADLKFLYYKMQTISMDTDLHKRYWISKYSQVEIPLPPLATQQKIAAILDAADELRQKDKALVAKYDELTQALFLDMFGDPVTNPKGWEKVPFGNHIDVLTDYHANGSYETLNEHVTLKNTTDYALMVRTTDLEKNNFDKDVISISEEAYNYLEKTKVFGGEMIINKIGSAGKVYMMPYLNRPVSLGMNAFMLRFKNTLNSTFIFFQLKTKYGEHEINKRVKGAVTKTIRKDAVREIPIILAPLKLQNQFAERVKAIEEQKSIAQASSLKSEELFNSLLQKAFNGELV